MVDVFAHFLIVQLRIFSVNMVGALHNLFVNSPCGISRPVAHKPCRRHAADIRASFHQKGFRPFPRGADGGSPACGACSQNQHVHRVVYRCLPLQLQHSVFFHSHFSSTFRFFCLLFFHIRQHFHLSLLYQFPCKIPSDSGSKPKQSCTVLIAGRGLPCYSEAIVKWKLSGRE